MRHQKHRSSLGVTREHRSAMMSNLAAALITHGRIKTTLTTAKYQHYANPSYGNCYARMNIAD